MLHPEGGRGDFPPWGADSIRGVLGPRCFRDPAGHLLRRTLSRRVAHRGLLTFPPMLLQGKPPHRPTATQATQANNSTVQEGGGAFRDQLFLTCFLLQRPDRPLGRALLFLSLGGLLNRGGGESAHIRLRIRESKSTRVQVCERVVPTPHPRHLFRQKVQESSPLAFGGAGAPTCPHRFAELSLVEEARAPLVSADDFTSLACSLDSFLPVPFPPCL